MQSGNQHTLSHPVTVSGIGLHSGKMVRMTLHPADVNTGIVFFRNDVAAGSGTVPALYDRVVDTQLGTTLANDHGVTVSTVEHLMAALWGCGIDNVVIELNAPEVPIMDGSSEPFIALIESAGTEDQGAPRKMVEVVRPVTIRAGESVITIEPYNGYALDVEIAFNHATIARQHGVYDFNSVTFQDMLSRARTFGFEHEVEYLRGKGLARGGSLDNAIVIGKEGVLNREGLRFNDEFVRHKALDCVGDFYLAGTRILGRITAVRPGHGVNNQLLHALFADKRAWRVVERGDAYYPHPVHMGKNLATSC